MGKIRLKINYSLPSPTDNIKVNPPPPPTPIQFLTPLVGSLIPNLRVGCLP